MWVLPSNRDAILIQLFYRLLMVSLHIYSCNLLNRYLFFKNHGNKIMDGFIGKIVNYLKKYTFSIYLLHWFVMKGLNYLYPFNTKSIVYRLGMPFAIIPICIALTMLLRKLPIIRNIVPQ